MAVTIPTRWIYAKKKNCKKLKYEKFAEFSN